VTFNSDKKICPAAREQGAARVLPQTVGKEKSAYSARKATPWRVYKFMSAGYTGGLLKNWIVKMRDEVFYR